MHGNMFGLKSNHFWSLKIKFWDQTKKYDFETNLQDQLAVLGQLRFGQTGLNKFRLGKVM